MIHEYSFNEIQLIRDFLLNYNPKMDLKHLFIKVDQFLIKNAHDFEDMENCSIHWDSHFINIDWYPIIKKSNAIGNLFNQLENICVLDRDS